VKRQRWLGFVSDQVIDHGFGFCTFPDGDKEKARKYREPGKLNSKLRHADSQPG
jgi:hypothetical protein